MFGDKLLKNGEQGQGVVTKKDAGRLMPTPGANTVRFKLEGHIKFPDGTQTEFRSEKLSSDKVGFIEVGAIVPVRYDASDHSKVLVDVVALEAQMTAKRDQVQAVFDNRKERAIAEADAKAAQANPDGPPAGS